MTRDVTAVNHANRKPHDNIMKRFDGRVSFLTSPLLLEYTTERGLARHGDSTDNVRNNNNNLLL